MVKHCPDCVAELVKNKKKLGKRSNWLVCPACGLREDPDSPEVFEVESKQGMFKRDTKEIEDEQNNEYYREG